MKVDFLLTIRMEPENKGDAADRYAELYRTMREEIETKTAAGGDLVLPPTTEIRWVLISKRFD